MAPAIDVLPAPPARSAPGDAEGGPRSDGAFALEPSPPPTTPARLTAAQAARRMVRATVDIPIGPIPDEGSPHLVPTSVAELNALGAEVELATPPELTDDGTPIVLVPKRTSTPGRTELTFQEAAQIRDVIAIFPDARFVRLRFRKPLSGEEP